MPVIRRMPPSGSTVWRALARVLGLALWVLVPSLARAETTAPLPEAPGYIHEVLTVEDGLPPAGISQALQSRDGFLWLATFDGLVRFDGTRFEVFDTDRVPALGSNRIVEIVESGDGALWVRSEAGHVARGVGGRFSSCSLPEAGRPGDCSLRQAGASYFTLLTTDRSGTVWIGGRSGLFRGEGSSLTRVPGLDLTTGVQAFLQDRSGRLWVGTSEGLWAGQPGRFERQRLPPDVLGGGVTGLVQDSAGAIWVATKRGVGRFRGGSLKLEIEGVGYLDQDAKGGVWIAAGDRLLRFQNGRFEAILTAEGSMPGLVPGRKARVDPDGAIWTAWANALLLNSRPVLRLPSPSGAFTCITIDREGTLWVPESAPGRLHALRAARVTAVTEGLGHPSVYPVYQDRDGSVWAGGYGSLAVLSPGAGRFRTLPMPGGAQQSPEAFLRDRSGTFWIGTTQGLFTLDASGIASPAGPAELHTTIVRALHEDARGTLWVGTEIGLFRREPLAQTPPDGRWSWITPADGLPHPWIRVIRETTDGALWLGTNGGGVIRYLPSGQPGGRFTAITQAQGLSSNLVRGIYAAPDGRLWIATENGGVSRLDPAQLDSPKIAVVGKRQGLFSSGVHQIVADDFGNLWMSSDQGIFRVSVRDLDAVADGRLARLESIAYGERDGMLDREANGGIQDAGFRDLQGRIWFPTQQGVVRIDPRRALERRPPPLAVVQSLRVGDEEIPLTDGAARLLPHQRSFSFDLTAPSFRDPERQRFLFRLTPYDRDWIDAGTRRTAFYTKVNPGTYEFQVIASGADGGWSEHPASVEVVVVPRFYETWWFRLVCLALAFAAVAAIARLWGARQRAGRDRLERLIEERTATIADQAEKLRELDRLKSQFFANVSHELRTPLTLILGPLGDALEGRSGPVGDDLRRQLATAGRNAQRLLTLVDQLLDVARLDAGRLRLRVRRCDLAALVRQRVEAILPLAERREIDLSLEIPPDAVPNGVDIWCDEAQIEKVLDNLLSNALKFTQRGGRVQVALLAPSGADRVQVSVRDNGPGIPADQIGKIFERFYQSESLALRWPGVGIGLALSRQLIELHQGSIAVESLPGEGSCFSISLRRGRDHFPAELLEEELRVRRMPVSSSFMVPPAVFDTPLPIGLEDLPDLGEDRTTVLVVEDNPEVRAYIRRHLEPDYRVIEAEDGEEGLAAARQFIPDLVVSDVMMPGLDGNALFRSLREDPELELVPVVLLTAKASAESRLQGLRDGVDDYLVKPFDPRELKARVDNLIASRRRLLERLGSSAPAIASPQPPPRPLRVSEVQVPAADEAFLARVQGIIEQHLGDSELSVEALADAVGCDRSYLLRKLRALTGETPSGLIRSLRLQRAEQLLRANAGTVSEVAYGVGFKSVAHFSNAFQERYGERPSAFAARWKPSPPAGGVR